MDADPVAEAPAPKLAPVTTILGLQVLRAVAAIAVAFLHIGQAAGIFVGRIGEMPYTWMGTLPWEAGVDIFFVISGFVMVTSSTKLFARPGAQRLFLGRRLARVVPLYWMATTLVVGIALAWPRALSEPLGGSIGYILASYLFIPWLRPDGFIQPVFRLGWTLNYEMLFYLVFALLLPLPRQLGVATIAAVILAFAVAGWTLHPASPQFVFWTDPIIIEFVFGMSLATLFLAGIRLPRVACRGLTLAALGAFAAMGSGELPLRFAVYGLPALALAAASVLPRGAQHTSDHALGRVGVRLGDASYAIYLIHPFPMRVFREIWSRLGWVGEVGIMSYIIMAIGCSIASGMLLHFYVETRLVTGLRHRLKI